MYKDFYLYSKKEGPLGLSFFLETSVSSYAMTIPGTLCTYNLTKPASEQVESFVWHTGGHMVVAGVINGLALYLVGSEDVVPGILIGGAAGLSVNLTHKVIHVIGIENKDGCSLPFGLDLVLAAAFTYVIASALLEVFEYETGAMETAKLSAFGLITIAMANQFQKDQ